MANPTSDPRTQSSGSRDDRTFRSSESGLRSASDRKPGSDKGPLGESKEAISDVTSDFGDIAGHAAKSVLSAATAQASDIASHIGDELSDTAAQQKVRGADALHAVAKAITVAARELEGQSPQVAGRFRSAARGLDSFSDDIRERSVQDLMHKAVDVAHRQPWTFFAGAAVAGFAVSRLLKSHAPSTTAAAPTRNRPIGRS